MPLSLCVALPLLAAFLCLLLGRRPHPSAAALASGLAVAALFGVASLLLLLSPRILAGELIRTPLPYFAGAGFHLDARNMIVLIPILPILTVAIAQNHIVSRSIRGRTSLAFAALLWSAGIIGAILADRLFLFLLCFCLIQIAQILLLRRGGDIPSGSRASQALGGLLVLAGFLICCGLGLLAYILGSRDLLQIAQGGPALADSALTPLAIVVLLLGCAAAGGVAPFRLIQTRALNAPPHVLVLLFVAGPSMVVLSLLLHLSHALHPFLTWRIILLGFAILTLLGAGISMLRRSRQVGKVTALCNGYAGLAALLLGIGTPESLHALLALVA